VTFRTLKPSDPEWDALLHCLPHDVYHLPGYARLCATHEPWEVLLAVTERGSDALAVPFMLREVPAGLPGDGSGVDITVPYGYPGPVASSTDPAVIDGLVRDLLDGWHDLGAISAFVRCHPFLGIPLASLEPYGDVVVHGDQVYLDLAAAGPELLPSFRTDHRYNIRRARAAGFTMWVDDPRHVDAFPSLYRENMRRVGAEEYYLFSDAYFETLFRELADQTHVVGMDAPGGDIAAISLVLVCGEIAQYHLSATDERYLKPAPIKLSILGMAELCRELGVTKLNLGGGVGGRQDSLFEFKAGFSSARVPFATARFVLDESRYAELTAVSQAPAGFFPAYRHGL
jgi:hypothetical protein